MFKVAVFNVAFNVSHVVESFFREVPAVNNVGGSRERARSNELYDERCSESELRSSSGDERCSWRAEFRCMLQRASCHPAKETPASELYDERSSMGRYNEQVAIPLKEAPASGRHSNAVGF